VKALNSVKEAAMAAEPTPEHVDVLVIGAGLSGIGAGYHLQTKCPGRSYLIVEARERIGGTWDLFRYPGIRSDSDMFTLGYNFRPWTEAKSIADGPSILKYVQDTASAYGIDKKIRFQHRVVRAAWSSAAARWTVELERGPARERVVITCGFLFSCAGYYSYEGGYDPVFAGRQDFAGPIIHPQAWPEALDYAGKRVVVIGSGATAVTLVPAMAETAAHVTMLQRSPTWIISRPSVDHVADRLRKYLPRKLAYAITRLRNTSLQAWIFRLSRKQPETVKAELLRLAGEALGPDYDVATHFTPRYNPWEQRLCLIPDGDLFDAIKSGRASVVTGTIDRFVPDGIKLASGETVPADIIVTATGLRMQIMGKLDVTVDGNPVDFGKTFTYKGMMYSGVPNLVSVFGYTNASWTLKADLISEYVCRLLKHMHRNGYAIATPIPEPGLQEAPWLDFSSGYIQRALPHLPKQGAKEPWVAHQNYLRDVMTLRYGKLEDGTLRFQRALARQPASAAAAA
jgi:cation diffusion facilitator CzcD-associated flavoprotein CzcO